MAKLIIICCFLCFTGLSALPIINVDEIPQTTCPPDSHRNDTLGSCTCLPCPEVMTCSQVLVEVYPGDGEPGSCCPHYECSVTEPVCNGTNFKYFPNKCTKCESCNSNAIRCIQFCDLSAVVSNCLTLPNETAIALGETWTENDGCTLCRCTLDGERDCQPTECLPVECDSPVRRDGECCQTCPDEAQAPPHFSILQPYSGGGPTRGPETEVEQPTSAEGFPLIPDSNEFSSTVYPYFYEQTSTTNAEFSSEAGDNIASSEAPLQENSSPRDLEISSTDSSMASSTTNGPASSTEPSAFDLATKANEILTEEKSTPEPGASIPESTSQVNVNSITNGPASSTEPSAFDLATWTSQILSGHYPNPAETTKIEEKSTLEPEALTPESTSQIKEPSEVMVPRDTKNNAGHLPYMPEDQFDSDSKWVWPLVGAIVLAAPFFCCFIWKLCKGGKKVKGKYHEVSTQQPQEVCNLKSFDDPHRK